MRLKRISLGLVVTALLVCLSPCPAPAESIEIQFWGLDLHYDATDGPNGTLYDAGDLAAENGNPDEADMLTRVRFLVDGEEEGVLEEQNIFADVLIEDIPRPSATGPGFAYLTGDEKKVFDLLTPSDPNDPNSPIGWGLALNLDEFAMYFYKSTVTFAASGVGSALREKQELPFGIVLDEDDPIKIIVYGDSITNVIDDGVLVTEFDVSGFGNIRGAGTIIPEPSSFVLVGIAIAGLLGFGWRKRRAAAAC